MSDKDTYRGVFTKWRHECIRAAFARYLEREPRKAQEYINIRLAEASRMEESIARLRTTI